LVLINSIESLDKNYTPDFLIIDDGSAVSCPGIETELNFEVIELNQNLGHQRAIAVGLCKAYESTKSYDMIVVMDGDGEDKPEDVEKIVSLCKKTGNIVFASRKSRHEGFIFKLFYSIYKFIFKAMIGKTIDFGNFSAIPQHSLGKIVNNPNLWNHYSGSIIRSNQDYIRVACDKEKRYYGESKMNLVSLVVHGLSAISIHFDTITVKAMLLSVFSFGVLIISAIMAFIAGYLGWVNLPFWTSAVLIALLMGSLMFTGISLLFSLNILISRNTVHLAPINFYQSFIYSVKSNLDFN